MLKVGDDGIGTMVTAAAVEKWCRGISGTQRCQDVAGAGGVGVGYD